MLSKEEIENIEEIKKMLNFTTDETSLKINNYVSKLLLKYMKDLEQTNEILDEECSRLEQKESILDKVTKFVTKIATENAEKYNSENQKEVDFSEWNLALEILNIIEGEKK